jgi:hypothetical protein
LFILYCLRIWLSSGLLGFYNIALRLRSLTVLYPSTPLVTELFAFAKINHDKKVLLLNDVIIVLL